MGIYLFNLAVDTQDDQFHIHFPIERKLQLVEHSLTQIQATLMTDPQYADTAGHPIRAIFVAPEYFFARSYPEYYLQQHVTFPQELLLKLLPAIQVHNPGVTLENIKAATPAALLANLPMGTSGDIISALLDFIPPDKKGRHYPYGDYETIRKRLTTLSEEFPKILIVPGTVAWKRPAIPRTANLIPGTNWYAPVPRWPKGTRISQRDDYFAWMNSLGETPTEGSWGDYQGEAPDRLILAADRLLKQDAGDLYGGAGLSAADKKFIIGTRAVNPETYIAELKQLEFGLAYNTVFFYLGGKKVGEYSKHSDYQEVLYGDAYKELAVALLTRESSVIVINGLKFGIEICLDHAYRTLDKYLSQCRVFFSGQIHPQHLEYYLSESAEAYVRVRNTTSGCKLKKMDEIPSHAALSDHEGDYILCGEQLHYVNYGVVEPVPITDYNRFQSALGQLADPGDTEDCITLTAARVETLITRNGGHVRDQLFYVSRETGCVPIERAKIAAFDAYLQIEYRPALYIKNICCCVAPPVYSMFLSEAERATCNMQLGMGADHRPNVHLILSACVSANPGESQALDDGEFIHSSSWSNPQHDPNDSDLNYPQVTDNMHFEGVDFPIGMAHLFQPQPVIVLGIGHVPAALHHQPNDATETTPLMAENNTATDDNPSCWSKCWSKCSIQ